MTEVELVNEYISILETSHKNLVCETYILNAKVNLLTRKNEELQKQIAGLTEQVQNNKAP